jgi:signal transduction histidine kinase
MTTTAPQTASVLLIDDEAFAEELIRGNLAASTDIVVHYTARAEDAVARARAVEASIVLVDLRMPGPDGFDVIRLLRADPATAHIPVILLSSEEDADIKARAFDEGANDYLVKWPDPRELTARIRYHSGACRALLQRDQAWLSLRHSQDELAQSQAALHQAQKMEAIGQLTGGVAHDFNNVLQIIAGNLQLVKLIGGVNDAGQARIDLALSGVERGARLAAHLLAFARRQPLQAVVINPGRILLDMEDMMRRVLDHHNRISIAIDDDLWNVSVDPSQLHNVILNLSINARDAMDGDGLLSLRAVNLPAGSPLLSETGEGNYVMIEVSDNGCGMPPEVLQRAFEPFFTTKPTGSGTGLGLSMVYGFVKQSGGDISIKSEPGKGTCVRIFLPQSEAEATPEEPLAGGPIQRGIESILVVEDEEDVRRTTAHLLSELGYRVLTAEDAASAITIVNSGAPIDLVFTDVIMPGKVSSFDLSEVIKEKLPDTPILFTSGYAEGVIAHGGKLAPSVSLLQKPYSADVLSARIRHLLRRRAQATTATQAAAI